jgi:hypothetical protein
MRRADENELCSEPWRLFFWLVCENKLFLPLTREEHDSSGLEKLRAEKNCLSHELNLYLFAERAGVAKLDFHRQYGAD